MKEQLKRILDRLVWGDEPGDKELVAWATTQVLKLINEARVEELEKLKVSAGNTWTEAGASSEYVEYRIKELKDRGYDKLPVIEVDADDVSGLKREGGLDG